MKIPLVQRCSEGQRATWIVNWDRTLTSRLRVILYFKVFAIYFRWRSKLVGGKRIILSLDWDWNCIRGVRFDFNSFAILVGKNKWPIELLTDMNPEDVALARKVNNLARRWIDRKELAKQVSTMLGFPVDEKEFYS